MIYTFNEISNLLGNQYQVSKAIKNKLFFKISHGLYTDKPTISELNALFKTYPNAILTLESAFSYYGLCDYVPTMYCIATTQNAHKITNKKVKQFYISNNLLNIGKVTINDGTECINIYNKERLLIELFRYKNRLNYSSYKEIVHNYRELCLDEKINFNNLVEYCSYFKKGNKILKDIQEVIL